MTIAHLNPKRHNQNTGDLNALAIAEEFSISKDEMAKLVDRSTRRLADNPWNHKFQKTLRRLNGIFERSRDLFADRDPNHARIWLKSPHPMLGHTAPIDKIMEGHMDTVERLLGHIEDGITD